MTGKRTYLTPGGGLRRRSAYFVEPLQISDGTWTAIAAALGREPTTTERAWLKGCIELHASMMSHAREEDASSADVKETLAGIAALDPEHALRAYQGADSSSRALISYELHRGGWTHPVADATGAQIAVAAAAALRRDVPARNGRPMRTALFDRAMLAWWQRLGGRHDRTAFAVAILRAVGAMHCSKEAVAKRLGAVS